MIGSQQLFDYARRFADRNEKAGRGTQFPTVREAARRFRCRQAEIVEAVETATDYSGEYFGLAVGIGIPGGGAASFDSEGDYQIEAY